MPVEIRELLVKTTIESSSNKPSGQSSAPESAPAPAAPADKSSQKQYDRLLKECVSAIMDNLSSFSKER